MTKSEDHPIERALRETAALLGLAAPPLPYMTTGEALLLQAQIMQELTKRIVGGY